MAESPQFNTAEYQETLDKNCCKTCNQPVRNQYYRVNGAMTCVSCAMQTAGSAQTDGSGAFVKALLFGIGGALIGLILYSAVVIMTGFEIGYMSLAVGYLVGRAIMMGSSGVGGRRYQIAALVLTYAAVSLSIVVIGLYQASKENPQAENAAAVSTSGTPNAETPSGAAPEEPSAAGLIGILVYLTAFGLASPILSLADPLNGLIGLVILFVGLRIAWKLTVGTSVPVTGPFNL